MVELLDLHAPLQHASCAFRAEHRLSDTHRIEEFDQFTDWPAITVKLAERGFSEDELRKILGLNYLRVFREVVG